MSAATNAHHPGWMNSASIEDVDGDGPIRCRLPSGLNPVNLRRLGVNIDTTGRARPTAEAPASSGWYEIGPHLAVGSPTPGDASRWRRSYGASGRGRGPWTIGRRRRI